MADKKLIYVVEDDPDARTLIRDALAFYGHQISCMGSVREARQALRRQPPDLWLIDLGLPDLDGLTLVREICDDARFGIIILTARSDVSDRVLGLELGADDYVVKPFEPRELVARVTSVIRRREKVLQASLVHRAGNACFCGWEFDIGGLTLRHEDGRNEGLTAAEAELLLALVKSPNRVLSRDQLQGDEFDRDDIPFDRSIDVRISRIRKKIGDDPKSPRLIKTVYGAGYLFAAEVVWH